MGFAQSAAGRFTTGIRNTASTVKGVERVEMIKISTAGMSRDAWLEARRGSIGGSDAATVLGLNPYSSPYALWSEKTGAMEPEDISGKESVRLGVYLEDYVARRFTEITGKRVRRENYILKNPAYPWAHANVDRMVVGEKAGLECKTTSELNLEKFRGGEYPANYYCQCMHYMAVTGYRKWYLAVLIGNREVRVFEIPRDEEEIAALMEAERRFWDNVTFGTAPEADGMKATGEALDALHNGGGGCIDLEPVSADIRSYLALKAQIKSLQEQMDACANSVKAFMGQSDAGKLGDIFVTWKRYQTSRFDKVSFQRDNPGIDLKKYSLSTEAQRFIVKGA